MLRKSASVFAVAVVGSASACSSPTSAPACTIEGTYSMTATPEPGASCDPDPGTPASPAGAITVTVSKLPAGSAAPYRVELQGTTGACDADVTATCKIQAKCAYDFGPDALTANKTGTFQYSWTFDARGFTGINSVSLPPFKGYSKGCSGTSKATGTRR